MMGHDFAKLLSPSQFAAATATKVPLCILAGAGTGKTRVITHRMAYLVEKGAYPNTILGVTFTNKAAAEMRQRVEKLLPGVSYQIHLGTFHGIAAKLLRRYGSYVDVDPSFLIYDQDDAMRLMKQIATEQLNVSKDYVAVHAHRIEQWQNLGLLPRDVEDSTDLLVAKSKSLYSLYWQRLREVGALDFNSILLKWRELLRNPESLVILQNQFRHILVDEYQDTNVIQGEIVETLGRGAETIAIVGDDDQSIYSWRGARPSNMQKFLDDMPGAQLIKLEENYRSTKAILEAANGVIARNESRLGKTLRAVGGPGVPVKLIRLETDRVEAETVINYIEHEQARGQSLSAFAVLMRTNAQSRPFEESLRRARLPYRLVGGTKFYDRKEIKDVLATLRAALNPKSDIDLERAIAAVPRGIGDTSVQKAKEVARHRGCSLMSVMLSAEYLGEAKIPSKTIVRMREFALQLSEFSHCEEPKATRQSSVSMQRDFFSEAVAPIEKVAMNAEQAVMLAIKLSGVAERLSLDKTPEAQDRLGNLDQLLSAAQQHVDEAQMAGTSDDALSFLEATALLSSVDDHLTSNDHDGAVTLMTLHAAKGLEFDIVFMVGMEEYGFPHARALHEDADKAELEEERRLAYVGMTRARHQLILTYARRRMINGTVKGRAPSRFLRELPREILVGDIPPALWERTEEQETVHDDQSNYDEAEFRKGSRVWHATFGGGVILEQRGMGNLTRAVVRFDRDGERRAIIARFLKAV